MNLVNKKVVHGTFGKGNIISCDEDYVEIDFESGTKKFVFPDVFGKYMTIADEKASELVKKEIKKSEAESEKEALKIKEENMLARERRQALAQKKGIQSGKANPELQSVFWCDSEEEEEIFTRWSVFVGEIKSGAKKGEPRRLARMNHKSACLITKRDSDMEEEDRQILGVFMAGENFNGKLNEDGYIAAHPQYRLRLSEEESQKMLFWNYYKDKKFPARMTWNSGKQRYFDNLWMAQVLQEIVSLRAETEGQEEVQLFFEYFCKTNRINRDELPKPSGSLVQTDEEPELEPESAD